LATFNIPRHTTSLKEAYLRSDKHSFHAVIEYAGGGGAFVHIPFDVQKTFSRKRVLVKSTIDGEPYRGTIVRMGEPNHILVVVKEIRDKIGKTFGDGVDVTLEKDTQLRVVEVPLDFRQALEQDPDAQVAFEKLAYTH
jgi:ribosomal protein L35AE/L33A